MKVVFLAAGVGNRMAPIIKDKCLLKFCGKELILHNLEVAKSAGLTNFVIIGSPLNIGKLKEVCGAKIEYAVQQKPRGMADAIMSAKDLLIGEDVVIVNAEEVIEPKAYTALLSLDTTFACMAGLKITEYFPGAYLEVKGNRLVSIVEKPGAGNEPSDLVSIGMYYFKSFDALAKHIAAAVSEKDDVYEVAMDDMIKEGYDFRVALYSGDWHPIKYPWHIHNLAEYFIKKHIDAKGRSVSKKAAISDKANISGDVIIEDGARVFEGATIRGPCYIGKNVVIGNGALVWNYSHICANSVVGFGSEIKHSYIGDACWFHTNYVGDSVVMDGSSFGSGTVTANFRFDERTVKVQVGADRLDTKTNKFGCIVGEGCKTGINVSILPGTKIGANSIIGPHVHLNSDLGPNKLIHVVQPQVIKTNPVQIDLSKKEELMRKLRERTK